MAISDADYNWALMNGGGGRVVQTDGSPLQWRPGGESGGDMRDLTQADIDALRAEQNQTYGSIAKQYNSNAAFQQFTPEQVQEYTAYVNGKAPAPAWLQGGKGIYSQQNGDGGAGMWWGPQAAPQHNDRGFGWGDVLTGGALFPYSEQAQTAFNDMKNGGAIMALPFLAAGGAALAGAGAAGGAGGAGAAGAEASGFLFPGEAATSGAAGVGGLSGSEGAASLLGDAGADTLGTSMPAAQAEDVFGGYNIDPNTGDVYYGSGDNPYGANYSGGTGNEGFNGYAGDGTNYLQQAQNMAKQLGITPASALGLLKNALTKGAPAVLGAVGANQQRQSLEALAKQYMDLGAPSRARYEASFAPGFTMANDPGYQGALDQAAKATLHGLSVNGNPAGSPNAWGRSMHDLYEKTAYPALQNFRNTNANAGGIATLQTAAPGAATGAIAAQGNVFNAIGAGANDIFNPQPSLAQTMAEYQRLLKQGGAVQ